jgi:hypothetical protein
MLKQWSPIFPLTDPTFFYLNIKLKSGTLFFLKAFLLAYIKYTGGIHCDISEHAYIVHWLGLPLPSLSLIPPYLKQLKKISFLHLMYVKYINNSHPPLSPLFTLLPSTSTHPFTGHILQSCLSFLIPKSVFKGVTLCISAVNVLYFGQFKFLYYSPFSLLSRPPIVQQLSVYVSSTCIDAMNFDLLMIILFPFPSSLSRIAQFCYYKHFLHVNVHVFTFVCVYIYFLGLSSTYEKKHATFVFLNLA